MFVKISCILFAFIPIVSFAEKIECVDARGKPVIRMLIDKQNRSACYADENWEPVQDFFVSKFNCEFLSDGDFNCEANYYPFVDTFIDSSKNGMTFSSHTYRFGGSKHIQFKCDIAQA